MAPEAPHQEDHHWISKTNALSKSGEAYYNNSQVFGFLWDLISQALKGRLIKDAGIAFSMAKVALVDNGLIDDRELLLERLVGLLQSLPEGENNARLSAGFIQLLWSDLPHPAPAVGAPRFKFMAADGSGNNPFLPDIGKAGTPYARSCAPKHIYTCKLPDPNLVFDKVLRRRENDFVPHPSGLNGFFFGFATNVIHTVFRTSSTDHNVNDTSSYVDLACVYGNDEETVKELRTFQDGLIWPDIIAEERLLLQAPTISAIAVMFSRNHNWIAKELLKRDERGQYKGNSFTRKLSDKDRDEDIFQTARLINVGTFATVVLRDYVRAILNLVTSDTTWILDPRTMHKSPTGTVTPFATGNVVSIEFNILYRWHSTISKADADWNAKYFKRIMDGKPFDQLTPADLYKGVAKVKAEMGGDRKKWCIPGLKRTGADGAGPHKDEDIARILQAATQEPAGAFRARGNPDFMRLVDVLGIQAARNIWGVCTLNEFRKFLKLKPFKSFKDHNSDPEIAKAFEELYGHPDNIELYPGLLAEESKPSMEGSGLCPGYTVSRAILADAVSLVRGDRFLTTDCNTHTFTQWGFQECNPDTKNKTFGGVWDKILRRNLPGQYPEDSVYSVFPFNTPATMKKNLTKLGLAENYNFDPPPAIKKAHA